MSDRGSIPKGEWVDHDWLVRSMARAAGVDLAAAEKGALGPDGLTEAVERCRGCGWEREGGGCSRWLKAQTPGTAEVPGACVNRETFAGLPRIAAG